MSCSECWIETHAQVNGGGFMEQKEQGRVIEKSINGCSVTLSFLGKGYTLNIKVNVSYEQFCEDWKNCEKPLKCAV